MNIKFLLSATALASGLVGTPAHAENFLDFCVDASATGFVSAQNTALEASANGCSGVGAQAGLKGFTADLLQGGYVEKVVAAQTMAGLVFKSTTLISFSVFKRDEGSTVVGGSFASANTGLGSKYGLYAVVGAVGAVAGNSFIASAATLDVYMDTDGLTATDFSNINDSTLAVTIGADDVRLGGTTTLLSGTGTTDANLASDGFAVTFNDFKLTSDGEKFFIAPRPFHINVYSDGDINDGSVAIEPGVALKFSGDVSAVFTVPEPTSLALVGLALAGVGAFGTRRKAA